MTVIDCLQLRYLLTTLRLDLTRPWPFSVTSPLLHAAYGGNDPAEVAKSIIVTVLKKFERDEDTKMSGMSVADLGAAFKQMHEELHQSKAKFYEVKRRLWVFARTIGARLGEPLWKSVWRDLVLACVCSCESTCVLLWTQFENPW